jgi:transposase InsO family protein
VAEQRALIDRLRSEYPMVAICDALDFNRSSYYHVPIESDDTKLEQAISAIIAEFPTYGYRRVTAQLRRGRQIVNHKRVVRVMRAMDLLQLKRHRTCRTTDSRHSFPVYPNRVLGLEVMRPDQVWVCDITYVRLLTEFIYLAVIMDVFTRSIRGWHLGHSLEQELTLTALQRALGHRRRPEIHHSDQGIQYAATAYTELLQQNEIKISMADVGHAEQNGYAERLIRTIKEEEVYLSDYEDYNDALQQIGRCGFLKFCHTFSGNYATLCRRLSRNFKRRL